MGVRSLYDPRDPWAFRNTWTGEIRNSYDDLWIWIPLIIGLSVIACALLIPILIHRYCHDACFCGNWCRWFDRILLVCRAMESDHQRKSKYLKEKKRLEDRTNAKPFEITHDIKKQLKMKSKMKKGISHIDTNLSDPEYQRTRPIESKRRQFSKPSNFYPRSSSVPRQSCKKGKSINRPLSLNRSRHSFLHQELIENQLRQPRIPPIQLSNI